MGTTLSLNTHGSIYTDIPMHKTSTLDAFRRSASVLGCGLLLLLAPSAQAQLFVSSGSDETISTYHPATGAVKKSPLVNASGVVRGIAVSGNRLYAAVANRIGLYNATTGAAISENFITGLTSPNDILLSEDKLYVVDGLANRVGVYNAATGAAINATLITGLNDPFAIAISGANLYVSNSGSGTVGKYTTSGAPVAVPFLNALPVPTGIDVRGNDLYVALNSSGVIRRFNAVTGAVIEATYVGGLNAPFDILLNGNDLYVTEFFSDRVGKYGSVADADFISITGPNYLAFAPEAAALPRPSVTIKGKKKVTTSKAKHVVRGTASATANRVGVQVRKGAFKRAVGTVRWRYTAKLKTGKNRIRVQARDAAGQTSPIRTIQIIRR